MGTGTGICLVFSQFLQWSGPYEVVRPALRLEMVVRREGSSVGSQEDQRYGKGGMAAGDLGGELTVRNFS